MKCLAVLIACALATSAAADVKGPGGKVIDCYCTDTQGARVDLGEMICLHVDGRMFMAQCQMSLNVPMWREISEGCLSSSLSQSKPHVLKPAVDPVGVDTHVASAGPDERS